MVQIWCNASPAPASQANSVTLTQGRHEHGYHRPTPRQERPDQLPRPSAPQGCGPLSATFTTLSDARKWVQVTEAAIIEGRHFKTAEAKRHTLAELIDRYLADVLPHKRPSTIPDQKRQLGWWKAHLGHYALVDITPALIAEYRDTLRRGTAKRRANATVMRYLAALSHAFTMAVRE